MMRIVSRMSTTAIVTGIEGVSECNQAARNKMWKDQVWLALTQDTFSISSTTVCETEVCCFKSA